MRVGHRRTALNGDHDDAKNATVLEQVRLHVGPLHEEGPIQAPVERLQFVESTHVDAGVVADEPTDIDESLSIPSAAPIRLKIADEDIERQITP